MSWKNLGESLKSGAFFYCGAFFCAYTVDMTTIFFNRRQKVSKVGKKPDFSFFIIFCCVIFQSQCMAVQPYGV